MIGFRIAIYFAYAIIFLFVSGLIVAGIWLVQQGVSVAVALMATPTEIPTAMELPPAFKFPSASPTVVVSRTRTRAPTITLTPNASCIPTAEAKQRIGATICVQGTVVRTYSNARAFFVEFDQPGTGFFGTVLDPAAPLSNLVGKCIQISGTLENFQGRPFIIFKPDQLKGCPTP